MMSLSNGSEQQTLRSDVVQLSRADVLRGALDLLDADGLEQLSMRKLAARLGVQHGGLYWHFRDKQALLNAMADEIYDGAADIDDDAEPLVQLRELAHRVRASLLAHRDGARLVAGTRVVLTNTLRVGDVTVRAARALGASHQEAVLTLCTIGEFVLGHVIEEQGDEAPADRSFEPEPLDAQRYPHLATALAATRVRPRGAAGFEHGLSLILAGLRVSVREPS